MCVVTAFKMWFCVSQLPFSQYEAEQSYIIAPGFPPHGDSHTNFIRYGWLRVCICFIPSLSFQFSSVAQSCPSLCDPMDFSTPGLPIHHQLPEFTQTHVHWVGDATQLSHPLSSPFPPTFNLSHHQGLTPLVLTLSVITPARNFVSTSFPSPFRVQYQSNIFISNSYPVLHCGEHF